MTITLISHGETIKFVKFPGGNDEWKVLSSRGTVQTGLTKAKVDEQVEHLLGKGFAYPIHKDKI